MSKLLCHLAGLSPVGLSDSAGLGCPDGLKNRNEMRWL